MSKFKVGDEVVWKLGSGSKYHGKISIIDDGFPMYPISVRLNNHTSCSFSTDGVYDIHSPTSGGKIYHLTKLERALK